MGAPAYLVSCFSSRRGGGPLDRDEVRVESLDPDFTFFTRDHSRGVADRAGRALNTVLPVAESW